MKRKLLKLDGHSVKSILLILLVLICFHSCKNQNPDPRVILDKNYDDEITSGQNALSIFQTSSAPGISVSVSIDGKTVWSEGIGYANAELKVPARPEIKYRIGQISQVFASMVIARLQEQGKIDVNDSFYKYAPDYPKKQWDFSPLNLGTHCWV